jgi:hypothetical protein
MSLITQTCSIICGVAAVVIVIVVVSFILWPTQPSKANKSKGERAKEMKQAFRSVERQNLLSGRNTGTDSIKVRLKLLFGLCINALTPEMKSIQDQGGQTMEISQVILPRPPHSLKGIDSKI